MKIIRPTKIFCLMDLKLFNRALLWGKKVKTHEMLEIIYPRVCLKDKFNNGKIWRDLLTNVTLHKLSKTNI